MGLPVIKKRVEAVADEALEQSRKAEFVGENVARSKEINRKVRERYSLSDELAIMRKALAKLGIDYSQLDEYNDYVEKCKQEVEDELKQYEEVE
jgi:hypothetical protein